MKKKWLISADSGYDLPEEIVKRFDVRTIYIWLILGEKSGYENEFTQTELYEYADRTGTLPKTAALSPAAYEERFREYLDEAEEVVHISLSSGISSSNQNASIAAENLGHVHVIDSKNLSSGFGHLVYRLGEMLEGGMEVGAAVKETERLAEKVDTSFILDTLEYMRKGGRCSAVAVLGANLLKLKPCIEVKDGKMGVGKKYRGNLVEVLKKYVDDRLADLENIEDFRIFVTHAGVKPEVEKEIYEYVKAKNYFKEVIIGHASCTISTHCGPNTLGVLFFRK
ncbi:MAG: DegV family protein [Clostridia bacterium]|nr:DegV family protein [Clostridia bacterium]